MTMMAQEERPVMGYQEGQVAIMMVGMIARMKEVVAWDGFDRALSSIISGVGCCDRQ